MLLVEERRALGVPGEYAVPEERHSAPQATALKPWIGATLVKKGSI
jgi:hypothetical protein